MKLASSDGTEVILRPVRYQFPERRSFGFQDWDANWLIIPGDVATADGQRWSFEEPCLTTWDGRLLRDWLRGASGDSVRESPPNNPTLVFTEPNIAFGLEADEGDGVKLLVYFSLESRPPSQHPPSEIFEFFLPLILSRRDLADAANEWDSDLAPFPER